MKIVAINKSQKFLKGYSPEEFVGLFKYADYVVTSSFHGLAFSLIYNRDFCAVGNGGHSDIRSLNLLSKVGLVERFTLDVESVKNMLDSIDFGSANEKLEEFKASSHNYIKAMIDLV